MLCILTAVGYRSHKFATEIEFRILLCSLRQCHCHNDAADSGLSEQPSFYDVMCGENGTNRISDDKCLEPYTNLTVVFLNRDLFPNGAYKGLWEKHDVLSACKELGCFIMHNNWINGRKKKLQRQMSTGLWDYDSTSRLCLQDWSDRGSFRRMSQINLFEDTDR